MKKLFKSYAVAWAVMLALFNVACFVSPSEAYGMTKFGGAFWSGYIFITLAFVGQLACAYYAFDTKSAKKLFYNIPIVKVSYTGLALTLIFGALCMAVPNLPNWAGVMVCAVILAFTVVAVIKAKVVSDEVERIDDKIKAQTNFIKMLTSDAESLMARAKGDEAKTACKKVYEAARYSDPMSNSALTDIEAKISERFDAFGKSVVSGNTEDVQTISDEVVMLISDRNKKCKV